MTLISPFTRSLVIIC